MLPAYTVEKSGFKQMLNKFNPRYDVPSCNHFSRVAISALYSEVKSEIQQKINDQQFSLSIMQEPLICGHQLQASRTSAIPYTSLTRIGICALSASKHIICLRPTLASIYKRF